MCRLFSSPLYTRPAPNTLVVRAARGTTNGPCQSREREREVRDTCRLRAFSRWMRAAAAAFGFANPGATVMVSLG